MSKHLERQSRSTINLNHQQPVEILSVMAPDYNRTHLFCLLCGRNYIDKVCYLDASIDGKYLGFGRWICAEANDCESHREVLQGAAEFMDAVRNG